MTKEQEQSLREWIARELDKYLESSVVDGRFSPYSYADTILAEVNRRLEKSALTPEQLPDVKLTIVLTAAQRLDPKNLKENAEKLLQYSKSVAVAQLKASLEAVNGK